MNTIMKLWPKERPRPGQYYLNVNMVDEHEEIAFWKFSLSGPGPNGPTIAVCLLATQDPVFRENTIQVVVGRFYQDLIDRWPIDIVTRTTY